MSMARYAAGAAAVLVEEGDRKRPPDLHRDVICYENLYAVAGWLGGA